MWGNSSADSSYQNNFNVGFSTTRSDVLIHLAQWQYWWWFWFTFLWCFYYLVILRTVKQRALKMRPKIHTSQRPHSKWGDFLACIVPTIWCVNILTNSNLILRLIEWQNESSLFTIRIRGRQWYWIYKFELKNFTDIITAPKNVGTNRWAVSTFGDLQTADDYLHVLQLRAQSRWVRNYWQEGLMRDVKPNNFHLVSAIEQFRMNCADRHTTNQFNEISASLTTQASLIQTTASNSSFLNLPINLNTWAAGSTTLDSTPGVFQLVDQNISELKLPHRNTSGIFDSLITSEPTKLYLNSDIVETSRWAKRSLGTHIPLRIIKTDANLVTGGTAKISEYEENDLLALRYGSGDNNVESKPLPHTKYLTLKQQRSKKKKNRPDSKNFQNSRAWR